MRKENTKIYLGVWKIMGEIEVQKSVNLMILRFFDYYYQESFSKEKYAEYLNVSDDSIRNWMKGREIRIDSVDKIKEAVLTALKDKDNPEEEFKSYLFKYSGGEFSSKNYNQMESIHNIKDILKYMLDGRYYSDLQEGDTFKLNAEDIRYYCRALKKKIIHDIQKNKFYDIRSIGEKEDNLFLYFDFPGGTYKVRVYLTDANVSVCSKLSEGTKNAASISTWLNQFVNGFCDNEKADAYVVFTDKEYTQENRKALLSADIPIYIKRITQQKLEKQDTNINYRKKNMRLEDVTMINCVADYMLYSLQCDFDLFLKNALSLRYEEKGAGERERSRTFVDAYQMEEEFEIYLLKRELVNLIEKVPKEQEVIKVVALNHESYYILMRAISATKNEIKKNGKIFQIIIGDNSGKVVELLDKQSSTEVVSKAVCCLKAEILDIFTEEQELCGNVDMIIVGMGTLSLFKNPKKYFPYMNAWLKKDGKIFLSVYSVSGAKLVPYKHLVGQNLRFVTKESGDIAEYVDSLQSFFRLYCKAYEKREIQREVGKYFTLEEEKHISNGNLYTREKLYMHPSIAPLVVKDIPKEFKDALCEMERQYSMDLVHRSEVGYFIISVAKKVVKDVKSIKKIRNVEKIMHEDAITRKWHYKVMVQHGIQDAVILKPILLKSKNTENGIEQLYCIVIDSNHTIAEKITTTNSYITGCEDFIVPRLQLLTTKEINDLGYEIGNLSPFEKYSENILYYFDRNILMRGNENFVFGSGNTKCSYKVNRKELDNLLKAHNYQLVNVRTNFSVEAKF